MRNGCGKVFMSSDEDCFHHPGPPVFHEGQKGVRVHFSVYVEPPPSLTLEKGWKCCKARVLTFDEFLSISPCTKGLHSTVVQAPAEKLQVQTVDVASPIPASKPTGVVNVTSELASNVGMVQIPERCALPSTTPESDSDDSSLPIQPNMICRRRGCKAISQSDLDSCNRSDEQCVYHPGHPLFHEGSKGWTCCKRRVLEFDEFMRIEGCQHKGKHLFVGSKNPRRKDMMPSNVR